MLRPAAVEPVKGEERIAPEPAAISGTALFNMLAGGSLPVAMPDEIKYVA